MKKLLVLAISFCCCFFSSCATKQKTIQPAPIPQDKCDVPVWNVGDTWRWRYSNMKEWQYTVERIEKDFYVVEDLYGVDKPCLDKNTLSLMASINPQGEKKAAWAPSGYYFDFPLYIGKKWSKMITAPPARGPSKLFEVSYLLEFKCVSYEDVTVPAGTFKAFKITYKQTNMFSNLDGKVDIWYSPEIKVPIKVIFERIPYWSQLDFALVSFKLKEKQSPQPEKELSPQRVDTTPKLQTPLLEKPKISAPVTSSPSTNIVTITGTSANIRSGAGNEFPVIATVKQGDRLVLLGEYGEWLNVRLENGQEGWINNRFAK